VQSGSIATAAGRHPRR